MKNSAINWLEKINEAILRISGRVPESEKSHTKNSAINWLQQIYESILGLEGGASPIHVQVQADYEETRTNSKAYIKNKPDLSPLATKDEVSQKQDSLVSGTNIKTINGDSILGSGNLIVPGDGSQPYDGEKGIHVDNTNRTIGHTNAKIVESSKDCVRSFTVDGYGHVTSYVEKELGRGINDMYETIGHSNTPVTAKSNNKICGLKYDIYGHITGSGTEYEVSAEYTTSASNTLFTRAGAFAMYGALKNMSNLEAQDAPLAITVFASGFGSLQKLWCYQIANNLYSVCFEFRLAADKGAGEHTVCLNQLRVNGEQPDASVLQALCTSNSCAIGLNWNGSKLLLHTPQVLTAGDVIRCTGILKA